ncbi:hypothetical protein FAVG1_04811 [Fusarium avenaceum]|nr:hypothetical protein FAVG1_04811 [Fusarium avenaceum]
MADQQLTKDEKALHDQTNLLPRRQLVIALATLSASLLLVTIDQNGISVALPTIAHDLNAESTISWAGTASLIANTCFQMLYGRLSDVFGRKVVFISAALLLCLADLLCSLSRNAIMFYVFRAMAGIGGGGVLNLCNIIISDIVTLERGVRFKVLLELQLGLAIMLSVGGTLFIAFVVWEWKWAKLPMMPLGAQMLASIISGQYISRCLRYGEVIKTGFALWTLPAVIAVILAVVGSGVGCIFQPTLIALQAHSPKSRRAVIISNRTFYRCMGGACGLAFSASVLQSRLSSALPTEYKDLASSTYVLPDSIREVPGVLDAYMSASHSVFILQVLLIGACLLATALIKDCGLDPVKDS